jgi:hypothetical protein
LPYREFLSRIRQFFTEPSAHLDGIADAFARGELQQPASPMSDQELAEAIRDYRRAPLSKESLRKLGSIFSDRS